MGNSINEKPVLDGDFELFDVAVVLVEVVDCSAASAADLAEEIAIVPPPAVASLILLLLVFEVLS